MRHHHPRKHQKKRINETYVSKTSSKLEPKIALIKSVLAELEPGKEYPVWVVIIEQKHIFGNFKMIQFDVYGNDKFEYQASIVHPMDAKEFEAWAMVMSIIIMLNQHINYR